MTPTPAPRALQMPDWCRHEDADVELVLASVWLNMEHGFDAYSFAGRVLGCLPVTVAVAGLERVTSELDLASRVEAVTLRCEFEDLTGLESHGPSLAEDVAAHAEVVRADAVMQAEQLVGRARLAAAS